MGTTLDPRLQRLAAGAIAGWLHAPHRSRVRARGHRPAHRGHPRDVRGRPRRRASCTSTSRRSRIVRREARSRSFTLAAALERGIALGSVWHGPSSLTIPDRECLNGNGPWVVHNFADETSGTMTLAQAIAHSVNTIFAQVVTRVGPARVVAVAHRMGIRSPLSRSARSRWARGRLAARDDRRVRDAGLRRRAPWRPRAAARHDRRRSRRRVGSAARGTRALPPAIAGRSLPRSPASSAMAPEPPLTRPSRGGEDRHGGELQRRVVLRLRPATGRLRVGRLPERRDPAAQPRRLPAGRRRQRSPRGSGTTSWSPPSKGSP